MKKLKTVLLAVAAVTVVGLCIYLRYFGDTLLRAPSSTGPDSTPAPTVAEEAEPGTGDAGRPSIREVPRIAINGFKDDLAHLRRAAAINGDLVFPRLNLGRTGRVTTGVVLEPEAPEPGSSSD